jgi:ribosomal protein L31
MPMEDACGQNHINHVVPPSDSHYQLTTEPKSSAPNNQAIALILCSGSHPRFVGGNRAVDFSADEKVAYERSASV